MKKNLLLVLLAMALMLAICGCGRENQRPTGSTGPDAPAKPLDVSLASFGLSTTTWSSPNGATVNLTAIPSSHTEGQTARFVVRLGQMEEANVPCEWDGTEYTASADLNAADGYGYYVIITAADGAQKELAVNTPENPYDETLVNLASSLDAYCTVTVDGSSSSDGALNILSGSVLVQLPLITDGGQSVTCSEAVLILSRNDEEINRMVLTLTPAEIHGSYEQALTDLSFPLPNMSDGQELSLRAEVTLSNGQSLVGPGGSWLYNGGTLEASVG